MNRKLHIALFHCSFTYSGGGERIVLEEAKELKRRGHNVEIWAPTLDRKKCYPKDIENLHVRTFLPQLPSFMPFNYAIIMLTTAFLAPFFAGRFHHVDVFIGENQPGAWLAFCIATILGKPYIVYMNQPNRLLYPRTVDREVKWQNLRGYNTIRKVIRHFRPLAEFLDRVSFTNGKAMLMNGVYIGQTIEKIYQKKGVICPAGTRIVAKNQLVAQKNIYKGSIRIANTQGEDFFIKRPFILLTNRHVPQKKFDFAIEAMREIVKRFPEAQLIIPGSFTNHTKVLLEKVEKLHLEKNIVFLGQIPESQLQKLYRNACVYVYTAPDEDFGMGVIEAMGAGVAVVAWNFAGPTVTVVNGKTGFLAKPYDIKDFGQKIASILSDPNLRAKMSKNAWLHTKKYFSWQVHTDILEKEIRKALS